MNRQEGRPADPRVPDAPSAVREHLVRALEADLVGPFLPDQAATFEEGLSLPPSRWYLTGFLAPEQGRETEAEPKGAACHGCLFLPEQCCERFNRYLDRALVVPTLQHGEALAFFAARL